MKAYIQRLGRALMLPVACLPAAALFLGLGYWIDPSGWGGNNVISAYLCKTGSAILDNLGLLFAVGVAIGMARNRDGASALSGLVGFMTVTTIMGSASMFLGFDSDPTVIAKEHPAFAAGAIGNKNVFFGIMVGCIAGALYNRFHQTKLPDFLAFFSGRRCVPILTAALMSVISLALLFIWPLIYNGLVAFGEGIMGMGAVGAAIYAFFNRLLIPTGLHHALNNVFWFNLAGIDDITKFWSGVGGLNGDVAAVTATGGFHPYGVYVTGMYQAGFFPIMMFGLPAGALAIWKNAKPENKKAVGSLMLAGALAAFFTGVTEPLEFSFMFAAFPLYVVHALLTALSVFIAASFQWIAGFNFSAGFIDWFLSLNVPRAHMPFMLIVQGLVFAVIYYFVFDFVIRKFNMKTPGRGDEEVADATADAGSSDAASTTGDKYDVLASKLYKALGGKSNVVEIENCTTRLRMGVNDTAKVDVDAIRKLVPGVKVLDAKNVQVIVGTQVQAVADAMEKLHGSPVIAGGSAPKA
ncbi:N-acetylglucosamine-specific PTS transporter subunit IIBC [Bifidobacterium simiiventris]|uniref:N-acetylglucosamine-specific PTS transporter subunit IIBC n=1 Tax=Bifidobacterium simiiventris TaxID=2834434 RepID=UPI001C578700|nr:N-acetylglucosamine-specific PTS transporter subunit IIBC [Bifidobacterium simiiventris]MBW3078990.1 N-acetylglucosamine-specific PTS transporter subunit IIBC [Bifidobacterium simiiventris]